MLEKWAVQALETLQLQSFVFYQVPEVKIRLSVDPENGSVRIIDPTGNLTVCRQIHLDQ